MHFSVALISRSILCPYQFLFFLVLVLVLVYVILLFFFCSFINHLVVDIIRIPKDVCVLIPGICEYGMLPTRGD